MLNVSGSAENIDFSDESVSEEVLRKAMEDSEHVDSLYISDEEMGQVYSNQEKKDKRDFGLSMVWYDLHVK